MKKRFFAILLCLVMIVGLLPTGALAAQAADGDNVFHKTELLEAGREYLIVAKSGSGKIYAMTAAEGGSLSKVEVEVDGDAITYDGTDAVWNIASAGDKFHLKYGDQYLNGKSREFTLADEPIADRYWVYENGSLVYNGNYYLTYVSSSSGSQFGYKSSGTVDIYVRGEAHDVVCTHEKAQAFTAKAATCTEPGNIAYWYCADCGKYFSDEGLTEVISESATVTKALGHDLGEWTVVKEATTTATGTERRDCSRCDAFETREYGPVATYKLTDTLIEGKDYLIVSANQGSAFALKNEVISSGSGYTAVKMMTGSEATITSDQKIQFADNTAVWTCGKNENGLTLSNGTAFLTGNGGGFSTGSASDVASRVWSYDSNQLIITSSSGSAYVVYYSSGAKAFRAVKTSDETHGGDKVYLFVKDDACTHEGTETVLKNAKEASCTEEGYTGDTYCAVCGELIKAGTVIEKKAHSFGDWEIKKDATEQEDGLKSHKCSVCDFEETAVIPKLDHVHTLVEVEAKAPTCTEAGHDAYWVCQGENGCNQLFADKDGKELIDAIPVVDALGHQLKAVDEVPAGCEKAGTKACWQCERCQTYFADEKGEEQIEAPAVIPAKGHSDELVFRNAKDATCTDKGYTGDAYCPDCGKLIAKGEETAALDHKWGEWTVTKEATATEDGLKTRTCSRCNATDSEVIPATGETPADSNVFVRTSKLENGKSYLIVVESSSGSTYALLNEGGSSDGTSMAKVAVTISGDKIVLDNAAAVWAATAHGDYFDLTNGNDYLEGKSGKVSIFNKQNYSDRGWTYTDGHLQHKGGQNTYTVYYDSGAFTSSYQNADGTVMLFVNDSSAGPVDPPEPPVESNRFLEVSKLTAGKEYVIGVKNSDGTISALTAASSNNGTVKVTTLNVTAADPAYVETDNDALIWTIAENGNVVNGKYNFYPTSSHGVVMSDRDRAISFADGLLFFESTSDGTFYLTFADGALGTSTDATSGATFRVFERTDGSVTPPEECKHEKLTKHDATDSTCSEAGHDAYWECDNCGQLFSDAEGKNAIDKPVEKALAAHKLSKVEKVDATCSKAGAEEHWKCDNCGKLFSDEKGETEISAPVEIKKLDHQTELKDAADPTCTEKGYTGDEVCSVCGEVVKKGSEIAALGHTPELRNKLDPTCAEKGYSGDYYCSVCDELIAEGNEIDALGHKWDEGKVTTEPTCTKEGVMTFTCEHDKTHTYTEPIEALGHKWSDWKVTIPATETEVGYEARTCSVCGERETREIPPVTHKHQLVAVAKVEPTCETAGSEACWQCEGCHKYFSDEEGKTEIEAPVTIAALGHDAEIRGAKAATCAEEGYTGDTYCKRCNKLLSKGEAIAKLAHSWGEWVVTKPATETTEGVQTRTCSVCGEQETRAIPVLTHEHTLVAVNGVAATCEDAGFEAYWKCTDCNRLFSDSEGKHEIEAPAVIAATGHELVKHDAKAPTETEPGNIEYWECSKCGKLFADAKGEKEIKLEDTVLDPVKPEKCDGGANCPSIELTDVDRRPTSWYHEAVDWAVTHKPAITTGTTKTTFSPNAECTREQMVTFLWRALGEPKATITSCPFTDVKASDYSYAAILWAYENEIVNGTAKDKFSPKAPVTREQVVTILWRLAEKPATEGTMPFPDVKAGYSYDAIKWAAANNVTTGYPDGTFAPTKTVTRAEIVTLLYRYFNK